MNKLVSKKPVLRFKEGKKIVKAQFGFRTRGNRTSNEVANEFFSKVFSPSKWMTLKPTGGGLYGIIFGNNAQKTPDVQNKYGTKEELLAKLKKYGSVSSVINNFKNKKSDISNPVKSVTRKPYFQSKYANRANEINPNDIIKLQKELGVKADGIWGDKTEAAYLASKAFNSPEAINITKKSDISPVQTPTSNIGTFAYNPTLVTTVPTLTYSVQPDYSIAYNAIKDNINTRYASTFMKKGGQLPSRNPIERFKNRK